MEGREIVLQCEDCKERTRITALIHLDNGTFALHCICDVCNDSGVVYLDETFRPEGSASSPAVDAETFAKITEQELVDRNGLQ